MHTICSNPWIGATTSSLNEPGNNGNERVLHIPQISKSRALLSNYLMSYPEHSLVESYHSVEMQSVYSTVLSKWFGFFD